VPRYRPGEVGTLATARAVGTLAYASAVYRRLDAAYADRCLQAARRGYAYLKARPREHSDGSSCPAYRADGNAKVGRQVRMYAAAGLLLATGEETLRADFEANYEEIRHIPDYNNVNGFAAALYLRAPSGDPGRKAAIRRQFQQLADQAVADGEGHPFQWASFYYWGSLSNGFHRTGTFNTRACLEDPARQADCHQALANVHYALGRNSLQHAYVSGVPGVTKGMRWSFHHWLKALDATPHDFPGMIAGGPLEAPDPNDRSWPASKPFPTWGYWGDPRQPRDGSTPIDGRYTDNDSWSTNEVAVNWQGAALYALHFARWSARGSGGR
jgi:endoglucanase